MQLAHNTAWTRGWYHDPVTGKYKERNFGEVLALMHSELSETLEAHRKDLPSDKLPGLLGVEEELADLLLRVFDTAQKQGYRLADALVLKNRYNGFRQDHDLTVRASGGKKY